MKDLKRQLNGIKILELSTVDVTLVSFLKPLIKRLKEEGFDVVLGAKDTGFSDKLKNEGFTIYNLPIFRSYNVFLHIFSIFQLVHFIRKERFFIVHTHTPVAGLVGRISAFLAKTPIIIHTSHGLPFGEDAPFLKEFIFINLERFLSKITDKIFFKSKEEMNMFVKNNVIDKNRCIYIGNAVNLSSFSREKIKFSVNEIRKKLNLPEEAIVVTTIARLTEEKGLKELAIVFNQLSDTFPNLYFLIVGSKIEGDRKPFTEKEAYEIILKNRDRFIFLGFREDIPEILKATDIFVLASHREGLPRSILEAMAMELPVVATNIRGCREEVVDGKTGFLFPVRDIEALKDAIIRLIRDKTLREKLGKNGRKRVLDMFEEKKFLDIQIKAIKELINDYKEKYNFKESV